MLESSKNIRMLNLIPTLTVFLASFLLFLVQPMVGKLLLPILGGTPMVWNTAMLFFQILLLAGYSYAFILSKIHSLKHQIAIHIFIFFVALFFLPLAMPDMPRGADQSPLLWQIIVMALMIGLPFFILSSSAPMIQKWFSYSRHKNSENPYFLYAASNAGSLLALLAYPFLIEPFTNLSLQKNLWSFGFAALIGLFIYTGYLLVKNQKPFMPFAQNSSPETPEKISWARKFLWVILAFVPSSLMLGYTQFITTDIASVPLFWVFPLALYLLTFIIAFSTKPIISLYYARFFQSLFFLLFMVFVVTKVDDYKMLLLGLHGFLFFFTALMCHQEMVALKPSPKNLNEFYVWMALGGALGGAFNSLFAPQFLKLPYEYMIVIILSLWLRYASEFFKPKNDKAEQQKTLIEYRLEDFMAFPGLLILGAMGLYWKEWYYILPLAFSILYFGYKMRKTYFSFALTMSVIMLCFPPISWQEFQRNTFIERNFFGVMRVKDYPDEQMRTLSHGTTTHGAQALNPDLAGIPLSYYHPTSGAGDVFAFLDSAFKTNPNTQQHIAALGLGTGSISCYAHENRDFNFYEIDTDMVYVAQDSGLFTYLKNCNSDYKIILGDARQEIQKAPKNFYDLIFVDVFSSDNIPVHVMTLEAIQTYLEKMKENGILVIHTSNRYFNLNPEIAALGRVVGLTPLERQSDSGYVGSTEIEYYATNYTLLTNNADAIKELQARGWTIIFDDERKVWSDDFVNLLRTLY